VILLTRLGGPVFALNADLVERADCTPDTVITLVDGKKYIVAESLPEVISLIRQFRASVVADAQRFGNQSPGPAAGHGTAGSGRGGDRTGAVRGSGDRGAGQSTGSAERTRTDPDLPPTNVVQMHPRER
jgi:flagellar protein FlbD